MKDKLDLQQIFPFELDDFQQQAIAALASGKSVVVCAPTGSGKTVIGEYAIYRALKRGKRVFYTTPLKALSNQKLRDFQEQFGTKVVKELYREVGLITGDILINPEAPIVVMTTEIFRNMLYETPIGQVGTSLENVETVVLDECHYISDRQRGTVWEESIIYCPPSIQLVALSATIGNPEELTAWINQVRGASPEQEAVCELINSNYRPVPLRFYFSSKKGLFPLLNNKQTELNKKLKSHQTKKNIRKQDCPRILEVIGQLREKNMLPAIYIIFSRKGCAQAVKALNSLTLVKPEEGNIIKLKLLQFLLVNNPDLQVNLLNFLADKPELQPLVLGFLANNKEAERELLEFLGENPQAQLEIYQFLSEYSELARIEQIEPLTRGIAAHHAGILPAWKQLVEHLFELGLVKVVFATATLAAGINMPARTTVISALVKKNDEGYGMLSPSEFLQIAGRAGRRGMDEVGHVVTIQTPFEGAKEAAYLATATPEALRSWFTPSYGMVLNLLQKHTLEEAKDLLLRSFAEYLAQLELVPKEEQIASITTDLAKLDIELAAIDIDHFANYEKLRERLKEEKRLLNILQQQAEASRKKEIAPKLSELKPGQIIALKGKHVPLSSPMTAVIVSKIPGSGQALDLVCLGADNYWYVVSNGDVADINQGSLSSQEIEKLSLPDLENIKLGRNRPGDQVNGIVSNLILDNVVPPSINPEVREQQEIVDLVQTQLDQHPLHQWGNPVHLIKSNEKREKLRKELDKIQNIYHKKKANSSYYWQDFLNLIKILQEFKALDQLTPTDLGVATATIRSENELWLGLALTSGKLEGLAPSQLAAAISALITETPRPDSWTTYLESTEVLEVFNCKKQDDESDSTLRETKQNLIQIQAEYAIPIPVWLEHKFIGLVEQWANGAEWNELCENTSLDDGDIVRMLRRTVDILWQIPQIPGISPSLVKNAKEAIAKMKRFPV